MKYGFIPIDIEKELPPFKHEYEYERFIGLTKDGYPGMYGRSEPDDEKHRNFLRNRGVKFWLKKVSLPFNENEQFLLTLVDVVWNKVTESKEVPSTSWAKKLIEKAKEEYSNE